MKKLFLGIALGAIIIPGLGFAASVIDVNLVNRLKGRILLQTQQHGEAWYLNPTDGKRYYMKDGATAYEMMRKFGMGITNKDLEKIPVGTLSGFSSPLNNSQQSQQNNQSSEQIVTKALGEDINLSSVTLRFISSSETQVLTDRFMGSKSAKSGAKFVIVNLNAINTLASQSSFPYRGIQLMDSQGRKYEFYDDSIMYLNNYIEGRSLAPSITENGNLAFEVPTDAISYGVYIGGSTLTNYLIPLK